MRVRMFTGLMLLLVSATAPVLYAKERILLHRIGPSESIPASTSRFMN
jgi:hypothetical protein